MKERTTAYTRTEYERKKQIMKEKNNIHFFQLEKRTAYRHNFANVLSQWQVAQRHNVASETA